MGDEMNDKRKYKPPQKSVGDATHAVAKVGLGFIPIAGAASSELLTAIVSPPLQRRRNQWMEEVGEALRQLEEKMGVVLESLKEEDQFIDISLEASRIAIKTSYQEKREALKNAILNSALPDPPEESLQNMFLAFIDTLTIWHLKLIELFDDPPAYIERNNVYLGNISIGSMSHIVENAFPELSGRKDFYDLIWKDLYSRSLVNTDDLHTMMSGSGIVAKRTTEIGKLFLEFIKSPIEEP